VPAANRMPRSERDRRRRVLSQNFLGGSHAVEMFMSMVNVGPDDLVLEIGAGEGMLTVALSQRCREVVAYEIDPHLVPRLRERTGARGNVHVVADDLLMAHPPAERFHVVGNVPFSITSQVVDWCLQARAMASATIITQLEYAKKRTGGYGRWSLLTVETWPWFGWELRGRINRDQFRPRPSVDTGVLRLTRREQALIPRDRAAAYRRMVEVGFGGVGGSLYRSLLRQFPRERVDAAFRAADLGHDLVVAFASPDDWLRIFSALSA
jgi:23S rRNA (adenine-N6)-dimethyltransferase